MSQANRTKPPGEGPHLKVFVPDATPAPQAEPVKPKKKRRSKLPNFLRGPDWDRLIAFAAREVANQRKPSRLRAAQRDELAVHIALYCGLRIAEICDLDIEHIDVDTKRLFVCEGKGDKDRYVSIPVKLIDRLREWIGGRLKGPVFVTDRNRRLCVRTLAWRMTRLGSLAGLTKHLHCHLLRHSYAVRLLETGADIRQIQQLLGHSDLSVTAQYLHCDTSRLQASVDRL